MKECKYKNITIRAIFLWAFILGLLGIRPAGAQVSELDAYLLPCDPASLSLGYVRSNNADEAVIYNNPTAIFYNTIKEASISYNYGGFTMKSPRVDIGMHTLSGTYLLGQHGFLGGVRIVNFPAQPIDSENGWLKRFWETLTPYAGSLYQLSLGYAYLFNRALSAGLVGHYLHERVGEEQLDALNLDANLRYYGIVGSSTEYSLMAMLLGSGFYSLQGGKDWNIGKVIIGGNVTLPMAMFHKLEGVLECGVDLDHVKPGNSVFVALGAGYTYNDRFTARLGGRYHKNHVSFSGGGEVVFERVSVGVGVLVSPFTPSRFTTYSLGVSYRF